MFYEQPTAAGAPAATGSAGGAAGGPAANSSRSFDNGFWVDTVTFNNPSMNKAVLMAQVTLMIALFLPGLNTDVLGLYVYEIQGVGWFLAFVGALSSLFLCEVYKQHSLSPFAKSGEQAALPVYEENTVLRVRV